MAAKKRVVQPVAKPTLGVPDALEAAQEAARNAQEGALKLQRAIEVLRTGLETIVVAEYDHETQTMMGAAELRKMACATLDEYSRLVGQNWRRHPLVGNRAGDRSVDDSYNEG